MTPADLTQLAATLGGLMLASFWTALLGPRVGRAVARRILRGE